MHIMLAKYYVPKVGLYIRDTIPAVGSFIVVVNEYHNLKYSLYLLSSMETLKELTLITSRYTRTSYILRTFRFCTVNTQCALLKDSEHKSQCINQEELVKY